MGFFCVPIKMPKSINVVFLLNLLGYFKVIMMVAVSHLGIFSLHQPEQGYSDENPGDSSYVVVRDGESASLVPVWVVVRRIKKGVPVVEYGQGKREGKEEEEEHCSVCLECMERRDEMRQLSNCNHVFHKECLDSWVDEGHLTCPLCRSILFPFHSTATATATAPAPAHTSVN